MSCPRVSVLSAVCNSEKFLDVGILSILSQSLTDFEYILVDDASTDESPAILANYAARNPRVRVKRNPVRLGVAGALNIALREARGEYLAILDADDLALPTRLAKQVDFLDRHGEFGAVGSAVRYIDREGQTRGRQQLAPHSAVARWNLLFGTSLIHSASLYRRQLVLDLGGYSSNHGYLCDYELLIRVAEKMKVANLAEELACYRRHSGQVSSLHRGAQMGQMLLLQYALHWRWLGRRPKLDVFRALLNWLRGVSPSDETIAREAMRSFAEIWQAYEERAPMGPEDRIEVSRACAWRLALMAHHVRRLHRQVADECWRAARSLDTAIGCNSETRHRFRRAFEAFAQ